MASATGCESLQKHGSIAQIDQPIARGNREHFGKDVTGDKLFDFFRLWSIAGKVGAPAKRLYPKTSPMRP
jgi:hypothetical protein